MSVNSDSNQAECQQGGDQGNSSGPEDRDVQAIKDTCEYICSTFMRFNGAQGLPEGAQESIEAMNKKLTELLRQSYPSDGTGAGPGQGKQHASLLGSGASNLVNQPKGMPTDTDTESDDERKSYPNLQSGRGNMGQPEFASQEGARLSSTDILSLLQRLDTRTISKPEVFDSSSGESFDLFLQQFEEYCSHTFKGSSSLWVSELGRFLKGEMHSALQSLKVAGDSYDTIKAKLLKWRRDTKDVIETET